MILVCAVTRPLRADDVPAGLDVWTLGRVCLVHESVERPPSRSREDLLAFARRIDDLSRRGPVLPMRFGTTVEDVSQLRDLATEREEEWAARLDYVDGRCELVVHLATPTQEPVPAAREARTGTEYVDRLVRLRRRQEGLRARLLDRVGPWVCEVRELPGEGRHALLVPQSDVAKVRETLADWAASSDDLDVAVTGPWPPYSFCEQEGGAA